MSLTTAFAERRPDIVGPTRSLFIDHLGPASTKTTSCCLSTMRLAAMQPDIDLDGHLSPESEPGAKSEALHMWVLDLNPCSMGQDKIDRGYAGNDIAEEMNHGTRPDAEEERMISGLRVTTTY
ncbi:hypothetical protein LX32DRAFT_700018 [Colletotrichum zoysiae]|uniref:Uncharacterized protein n=1 Tax=Colletotrichum zoysiae TaxID=1216348 RepID=A0AAD9H177_9PEZI|nr:hypothetical protein LX32DRAFT_700018 [Colletotrichum zoysiae]